MVQFVVVLINNIYLYHRGLDTSVRESHVLYGDWKEHFWDTADTNTSEKHFSIIQ